MISMNSNSCATCPYLPSFHVLFCFWTWNYTFFTSVTCVKFLLPYVSLQSNWAKNLQNCQLRFLCEDFRLCSRYNNVNYGARHVYKPLFGSPVAIYPPQEMVQFGRWRDLVKSSPPLPGLVLNPLEETLLQPVLKTFITVFIIMKGWKINLQELRF